MKITTNKLITSTGAKVESPGEPITVLFDLKSIHFDTPDEVRLVAESNLAALLEWIGVDKVMKHFDLVEREKSDDK